MKSRLRHWLGPVLFAGLFLFQNAGFLSYVRAGSGVTARSLLAAAARAAAPLGAAILFFFGVGEIGRRLVDGIPGPERPVSWNPALAGAVGLAATSLALEALGIAGFFKPGNLLAVFLLIGGAGAVAAARCARRGAPPGRAEPATIWEAAAAAFLCYWLFCVAARALAPATDIDVLKYHLELPKLYLLGGRVVDLPWNVFSHWPQMMEMPYALGLAAGSDALPALMHAGACAGLVATTYLIARDEFGRAPAVAAAVILAAQPGLIREAGAAMNDGALSFFYLVSCACLWRWDQTRQSRWLKIGALLSGAAAAVKFHGLILSIGLAVWVAARAFRRRPSGRPRELLIFAGWAAVFSVPWYGKAWIAAGNPIWPFMPRLFGGRWGAAAIAAQASPELLSNWAQRLGEGHWILIGEGAIYLIAPALAALAWLLRRPRPVPGILFLLLAPLPFYLPMAATSISFWRYMLPFFAPLSIGIAWTLFGSGSPVRGVKFQVAAAAVAALCTASSLWGAATWGPNNALYPLFGVPSRRRAELSSREAYLAHELPAYDFIREANRRLGPGDRVLLIRDDQGYYYDVDYMYGDPVEQAIIDYKAFATPAALRAELARLGVTYIAVNYEDDWYAGALRRLLPRTYALIDATAHRYGTAVLNVNQRTLYALEAGGRR